MSITGLVILSEGLEKWMGLWIVCRDHFPATRVSTWHILVATTTIRSVIHTQIYGNDEPDIFAIGIILIVYFDNKWLSETSWIKHTNAQ